MEAAPALRVLLGDLAPIMAIGLRAVLEEDGIAVVGQEPDPDQIVAQAQRTRPDVVVLDLDHNGARALGERIRRVAPGTKVILWARDETVMEVLESVSRTPRLVAVSAPDGLRDELSNSRPRQQVEE